MKRTWGILLGSVLLGIVLTLAARGIRPPQARGQALEAILLSEILAGPARDWDGDGTFDPRDDEWVEVWNAGGVAVDLASYALADADSTIRIALSGLLAPGAVRWIPGSEAEAWQRAVGRTATGLSLNNAGDTVILFRTAGAETTAVDVKPYNSIEGASDRSAGRLSAAAGSWVLFDALNPYGGAGTPQGTGCAPTPGGVNGCTSPTRALTWGTIKRLIR